ncbi:PucR family transcriptional regulator [Cryptosporangium phraense]|uniref:PucR family transcriptional regulator n=1 Tax=Cryptosporangium phraense TaxID=2593070 RepID=UPI00197ACAF5|nr:PucR family transcriptional regulator [Cryptosporangium phraense]
MRDVLEASSLTGARVLAGDTGLDRVVQRLNVMEVPDILPWVKPHELLLTTGYPLRHYPSSLVDLVRDLDERGLAALAVKPHRYLDGLPADVLAEADRRGFPIIEVTAEIGFDDILNDVLSALLHRQASVLARSDEVHRALVGVVLEGGDLSDLAAELTRIFGGPVVVTTPDGRVIAGADALPDLQSTGCFDPTGRFRVDEEPTGVRPHSGGFHTTVPVVAGRIDHGRIVAFSASPLDAADVYSLERAATVAALAVTKQLAIDAVEGKYRADFLRDLLTGRVEDVPTAVAHARTLGWDVERPLVAVVAELDPAHETGTVPELRPVQERFATAWQSVVRWRDARAPVVNFNQEVVVLLGLPGPHASADMIERAVNDLVRQVVGDGGGGRRSFSLGISRPALTAQELPRAYEQARKAVRIGRRLHGDGARASFDRLGVHRLLSLIPDTSELRGFVEEVLGELAADTPENADLRRTLAVLLETNCTVAEAARRLHFHYNTLRYRITKLEKLVGPFTDDAALRLDLALALRVLEIRGL